MLDIEIKIQNALELEYWPKSKIFAMWLVGTMLCMLATTIPSALLIASMDSDCPVNSCWTPSQNIYLNFIETLPLGWVFHLLLPLGWGSIGVLVAVLNNHRITLLLWSGAAALISGIFWPPLVDFLSGW